MVALVRPAARVGGTEVLVAASIEKPAKKEVFEASDGIGTTWPRRRCRDIPRDICQK